MTTEQIKRLATREDAEGNPRIRLADGRTLRRECPIAPFKLDNPAHTHARHTICNGIGWLPISEAEAVLVCLQYAHEHRKVVAFGETVAAVEDYVAPIHDHNVAGALFEAMEQVLTEIQ